MKTICFSTLIAIAVIVAGELLYQKTGGPTGVVPGWTPVEYQRRTTPPNPGTERTVLVVGDSRVGYGFDETAFMQTRSTFRAVNAGLPAASTAQITDYLVDRYRDTDGKKIMVVHFSFGGFYNFRSEPTPYDPELKVQDLIDERIDNVLNNLLHGRSVDARALAQHALSLARNGVKNQVITVDRRNYGGFVQARLVNTNGKPLDEARLQLNYYQSLLEQTQKDPERWQRRRQEMVQSLARAKEAGWEVRLFRMPVGQRMRTLEEQWPEQFQPEAIARELQLPYRDFGTGDAARGFTTLDESHLDPKSARVFSLQLGEAFDQGGTNQWSVP